MVETGRWVGGLSTSGGQCFDDHWSLGSTLKYTHTHTHAGCVGANTCARPLM